MPGNNSIGIAVHHFLHGPDHPLTQPMDKTGGTRIMPSTDTEKDTKVGQGNVAASKPSTGPGAAAARTGEDYAPSALKKVDQAERQALDGYSEGGMVKPRRGYEGGGPVTGPGTGTSDSVPIAASNGEYVVKADVVKFLGTKFFDDLVAKAMVAMGGQGAAPNPFEEMAQNDMGEMEPGGSPSRPPRRA